ncbi:hypothetical protein [Brevundimonas balnearis]|uniref:Uncharacterized protein n=1 Tax=Brevundimonas balnearis TaxID=1572858 RepID=A0ABV6R4Z3_9CAUL
MKDVNPDRSVCPIHGRPTKRESCGRCNAAYMRSYQRRSRRTHPHRTILERARERARRQGVPYSLRRQDIAIPDRCPVLGIPLQVGQSRSRASPSLDRIDPDQGYVVGNVRVISDHANKLKGNRKLADIQSLSLKGPAFRRAEYRAVAAYMEREALLAEVREKAARDPNPGNPWQVISDFLEQRFRRFSEGADTLPHK